VKLPKEVQHGIVLGEVVFFRCLRDSSPLGGIAWARIVKKVYQKLASFRIAFRGEVAMPEEEFMPRQFDRHFGAGQRLPVRGHDLQLGVAFPVGLDIGKHNLSDERVLAFKEGGHRRLIIDGSRGRVQCFPTGFN